METCKTWSPPLGSGSETGMSRMSFTRVMKRLKDESFERFEAYVQD